MKEEQEFIDAIQADVRWLGFEWGAHLYYASDYFEQLYQWAVHLIEAGLAYVDDLDAEPCAATVAIDRGGHRKPVTGRWKKAWTVPACGPANSRMARGCCGPKSMAAGNINLRDPVLYRFTRHPSAHRRPMVRLSDL